MGARPPLVLCFDLVGAVLFGGTLIWAFTAKIDQTVTVRGRLEPSGSVRDVESPSAGVVSKVFVKDGEVVKQGQPLFDVEAKGLSSRRKALETTLALYSLQASTLTSILSSGGDPSRFESLPDIPAVGDPSLNAQLNTVRKQSQQFRSRLEQIAARIESRRNVEIERANCYRYEVVFEAGAMSRNQYLLQLNQAQETRVEVYLEEERSRVVGQIASH